MDGACADMGGAMMPPDGGYDHAPMPADAVMPPPMGDMDGNMAAVDPAAPVADDPMAGIDPAAGAAAPAMEGMAPGPEDGGMGALGDALGGPAGAADAAPMPDAADAAIGAAMDGAMDQGGAPAPADPAVAQAGDGDGMPAEDDGPEVDPSAGMG